MSVINLEHLVGRRVLARDGAVVGHIEAIHAENVGDDLVVTAFDVGAFAILERLSASTMGTAILDFLRLRRDWRGYRIPFSQIDLSDPLNPRLLGALEEIPRLGNDA